MKKITFRFMLTLLVGGTIACSSNSDQPYADLPSYEMGEVVGKLESVAGKYGESLDGKLLLTHLPYFVNQIEEEGSAEAIIQGEIKEVCTSKGCWLSMDLPNGESMRVTFKDYGFFVPTNSQGFPIILKGVGTRVETDVETLRHYAEDQGKSQEEIDAITEPKSEITFEAVGVIIPEKA